MYVTSAVPTPALEQPSTQSSKRPIFLKPLEDLSHTEGSTVNLECSVLAHPAPSISWFWNRAPFEPSSECSLSFDGVLATLQIEAVSAELSGMFKCVATNSVGSARTLCNLSVQGMSIVLYLYIFEYNITYILLSFVYSSFVFVTQLHYCAPEQTDKQNKCITLALLSRSEGNHWLNILWVF